MRKIITSNSQIEFQEVNSTGTLLNSIGLQLGEVYFIVKGNKVSFYLNDSEKPFDSFIWSIDIPFYLDDTLIETPNDASAALRAIMNDSFQEQLDALQEELATEEGRAQEAEEQLDDKIEEETARAINQENRLQDEITELSGTVATFDERITRNTNDISALTNTVNDEISRSVAKDAQHDAEISGLTNTLNSEIQRALSAETQLHNDIINEQNRALAAESAITANLNTEIQNRIADVDAEEARAIAAESSITANLNAEIQNRIADVDAEEARALLAESGITNNLNAEISRSTAKDAAHDAEISGLSTSIQNEIQRAQSAENSLRNDLNTEIANRISGDTNLQNQLNAEIARAQNAEEDLDDKIDGEIARANSEETKIEGKLDNEISRSIAKDVEHDTLISGLTDDLASEISRAQNAETSLDAKIDAEIGDRINAISGLNNSLNAEITRSTSKDASHDAEISGLTTSLQNEIQRAQNVENSLRNDLNDEVSDRTSADSAMLERIVALEVGKANKSEVYTKVESDAKYATKDYVSGLTDNFYTKGQTNELLAAKADKVDAVASAEYVSSTKKINFKNIDGAIISEVDATAFIKDGMVDNVEIVNGNLVITFNTDSGKEPISIPLTDIFNPNNYYTKTEINNIENAQNSKINEISGKTDDVITEVQTISGDVQTLNEKVDTISGESVTSGEVQTQIDNSISGKADKTDIYTYVGTDRIKVSTAAGVRRKAIDINLPIYNGSGMSSLSLGSGISTAQGGNQIKGYFSTGIGFGLTTNNASEVATGQYNISNTVGGVSWGNSGNTLFSVGNGEHQGDEHNAFEVRQNGDIYITSGGTTSSSMIKLQDHLGGGGGGGVTPSEVQTMIDESISGKTNQSDFAAHTSNNNVHVTASEKSTWNAKSDFSGDYNDLTNKPTIPNYTAGSGITISNNVISAKIWSGTLAQYNALSTKYADTIYLIYNS